MLVKQRRNQKQVPLGKFSKKSKCLTSLGYLPDRLTISSLQAVDFLCALVALREMSCF
jgi:hypothetical protein